MSNASFFDHARNRFRTGFVELQEKWGWYFALGVFLTILGVIACGMAVATTLLSVVALGWILLVAGAGMCILSFLTGRWSGFLLTLAAGFLSGIAGISMLTSPVSGAVAITMVMGLVLIVAGLYRSISAMAMQFPNWGWAFFSGIIAFALGVLLLKDWQTASFYFLGLAVGIDLILHGLAWSMFALKLHSLPRDLGITEADLPAA
jgi:uncharacterized membrane protein HdeD (DUF308 family)